MKLNLLKTIYCLFFFPAIFRELKEQRWWKGVISLILTTFAISLLVFFVTLPQTLQKNAEWSNWFGEQISELSLRADGNLQMVTQKQIPFSSSYKSFLLIVEGDDATPDTEKMDAPSGLWVSSKNIYYWESYNGTPQLQRIMADGKVMDYLALESFFVEKDSLSLADYKSLAFSTSILYFVFSLIGRVLIMWFYLLALAAMHRFIGSPVFRGLSFSKVIGLYCFASIPPMIFAVIYSTLPIEFLDFSSAYLFSLLFYMFFIAGRYIIPREILEEVAKGKRKD